MADCFITRRGGGSGGLNFVVVGGDTKPSNPKENTLWANTAVEFTSWIFSADEPQTPEAGMLWIVAGDESNASINAIKKNSLYIYPLAIKQYLDGEWVELVGEVYKGGEWIPLAVKVYVAESGKIVPDDFSKNVFSNASLTSDENQIKTGFSGTGNIIANFATKEKWNVDKYRTLFFDMEITKLSAYANENRRRYGLYSSFNGNEATTNASSVIMPNETSSRKVYAIDISDVTGSCLVGSKGVGTTTIYNIWFE